MADNERKPIRIMLVDDEKDLVEFLAHRLVKRGFTVTATTSGADAINAAKKQIFDVVILDLKMPQMDGITVLQHLKAEQPYLEAIMLTGHGSTESALEAGRLDAYRYLIKPYDFDELVSLINEAHTHKFTQLQTKFQEEMTQVSSSGLSTRDIIEATEQLRKKYEQD
jgi:two-component system NtrC family response regulator